MATNLHGVGESQRGLCALASAAAMAARDGRVSEEYLVGYIAALRSVELLLASADLAATPLAVYNTREEAK